MKKDGLMTLLRSILQTKSMKKKANQLTSKESCNVSANIQTHREQQLNKATLHQVATQFQCAVSTNGIGLNLKCSVNPLLL
mgnify:CR=1 FL=1